MKTLNRQDMSDLLHGATILGAGGGGDLSEGMEMVDTALAAGKSFQLAGLDDLPQDALGCCPSLLGAISDLPPNEAAQYARLPTTEGSSLLIAFDRMQTLLGKNIAATVACEMGGANTAAAFFVAAMRDGVTLDADPAGRAVPEITHSTFYLNDLPAEPICVANNYAETMVLEGVVDDARAEILVRALAQVSANDVAAVDHALPINVLQTGLISGTMSQALRLGQIWRESAENGKDTAEALATASKGKVVFRGIVSDVQYETKDGFTLGRISMDGPDGTYVISVKNENMSGHLNGQVQASIPDILTLMDTETGAPISNPDARVGQRIAVLILPAPAPFLSP